MQEPAFEPLFGRPKGAPELFEQRVTLLEDEVRLLHRRLGTAYRRIAELEGRDPQLVLEELIAELEKAEAERLRQLESEQAEERDRQREKENKKKKKPRKGHGPRSQLSLEQIEELFELPEDERVCNACGHSGLKPMGSQCEESEDIHVYERRYVKRVLKRQKYRCSKCHGCVKTAPGPPRVIPGGRYSLDFMVQVAADKWLDHVPLERQVRIMERSGLEIGSQTLFDQARSLAELLRPIYERLGLTALEADVLHADETRWPRLDSKKSSPWTVWTRTTPEVAHYAILSSKSEKAARSLFEDYQGTIVVDGYQVYENLARDGPDLELANCWAHVRRKFKEQRKNFPCEAQKILALIRQLYDVEGKIKGPFPGDAAAQERRLELRREDSAPILEEIWDWAYTVVVPPRSELGKAVRYMLKRKKALSRFLDEARIPLDNNAAERSLRGLVVGRKVHYGSKSKRGTEVAAIFYTLFETAKLLGIDPVAYVKAAALHALKSPGSALLPHDYKTLVEDHSDG